MNARDNSTDVLQAAPERASEVGGRGLEYGWVAMAGMVVAIFVGITRLNAGVGVMPL